jgi:hypothetical protein
VEVVRGVEAAEAGAPEVGAPEAEAVGAPEAAAVGPLETEAVAAVVRSREPAPERVQSSVSGTAAVAMGTPVTVRVVARVPGAERVPVVGQEADSAAAWLRTASSPGPTAFPQFAVTTASHPGRE